MSRSVIIFPLSFPYSSGQENSFLQNEITVLCESFDKVIIIPSQLGKEKQILDSKAHIEISFAQHLKAKRSKKALNCFRNISIFKLLFSDIFLQPDILFNYKKLKTLLTDLMDANHKFLWLNDYFKNNLTENTIAYSYWFTSTTTALCLLKKKQNQIKVITRAHGIDLFKIQNSYYPFREFNLKLLDKVILVSLAAKEYLAKEYPKYEYKFLLHRLGVLNHHCTNSIKYNTEFNIVSCSSIIPIKRMDLLVKGLLKFSQNANALNINWHHFGDGFLLDSIKELLKNAPNNLKVFLHGHVNNDKVIEFYKTNPVNVFITTSLSEGGCPVSIQEAFSFGIPAIGTAVGGIPEIIDNTNGVLLSEKPNDDEIAKALMVFCGDEVEITNKRTSSKRKYEELFDANKNFKHFVENINSLF